VIEPDLNKRFHVPSKNLPSIEDLRLEIAISKLFQRICSGKILEFFEEKKKMRTRELENNGFVTFECSDIQSMVIRSREMPTVPWAESAAYLDQVSRKYGTNPKLSLFTCR
jgi:hypothetical protein